MFCNNEVHEPYCRVDAHSDVDVVPAYFFRLGDKMTTNAAIFIRLAPSEQFDAQTKKSFLELLANASGMDMTAYINYLIDADLARLTQEDIQALDKARSVMSRLSKTRKSGNGSPETTTEVTKKPRK